jgi:glycosyltransferase involved in cell wall biosynthesis
VAVADPAPKLSVIIPTLDAASVLPGQLDALAAQSWAEPWELIVVDSSTTDDTRRVAEGYRGRIRNFRTIVTTKARGQPGALNLGVEAARADAVAFCDADDEVGTGWLEAMGNALARHELVSGRQDDERLNEPWVRASREAAFSAGLAKLWFPPYFVHAGSGAMGVRTRLHEAIGGFDESMEANFDMDYCIRAQLAGAELVFVPEAVVHYRYRTSLRGIFHQSRVYGENVALIQRRYKPKGERAPGQRTWLVEGWKPVVTTLPRVHRKEARGRLAWLLGWQFGRYVGSARYRVLAV